MVQRPEAALRLATSLTARERRLLSGEGQASVDHADQLTALQEAVAALDRAGMPCALIGGLAVGVRAGVPRATMDVDLAVATAVARERVTQVLSEAGFALRGEHAHSVNFRHRTGEPLQVAFDPHFDEVIGRAEPVAVGRTEVPVAVRSDLIAMKQRAAEDPARRRSKALRDLADVELLRGDVPDDDEGW
ncbi:MAG TPA: nucleotidyl transferase AbiEii/AbiGii toxin family protein [Egibacteraceae bacterium]|jgi:hypothetical protein|nr:nucleotidyl transferase AbiEii/AbiGii toxin family protein [Egibacteraceae bacterium]